MKTKILLKTEQWQTIGGGRVKPLLTADITSWFGQLQYGRSP